VFHAVLFVAFSMLFELGYQFGFGACFLDGEVLLWG
jgi:hypothetical protein